MKKILFFSVLLSFFAACKAPLPFYFDKPIGEICNSFPESMRGNYFILDNTELKEQILQSNKYEIIGDSIFKKKEDSSFRKIFDSMAVDINKPGADPINNKSEDSLKSLNSKSIFDSISGPIESPLIKMNTLKVQELIDASDNDLKHTVFGFFHFSKTEIEMVAIDSAGKMGRLHLITLSDKEKLSVSHGRYFLNFYTPNGWEVMMFEPWHDKYMCVDALYIRAYNEKAGTEKEFLNSVSELYPGIKILYNSDKKIAGVKVKMDEKALLRLFERSEEKIYLMKE